MRGRVAVGPLRTGQSAFTLIELLVVVSIIALLISILLPSLRKARDQAKDVSCKANLRSMGQAFVQYADKYSGVWPAPVDSLATQNRWPRMFFDGKIIDQGLNAYDDDGASIRDSGASVFLCPAEKAPRAIRNWNGTTHTVDRVEIGGSYAYNEEIQRPGPTDEIQRGRISPPPPLPGFIQKVDFCKRPSAVIGLMDNHNPITSVSDPGWRYNRENFFNGYRQIDGSPAPKTQANRRIIGNRHGGRLNAMAMDTHVASRRPMDVRYDEVSWFRWTDGQSLPPGGR